MAEYDSTYPKYNDVGYAFKYPLMWKDCGDWSPSRSYNIKNVVRHIGSLFESKIDGNTYEPAIYDKQEGVVYFNTEYWKILVNNTDDYVLNDKIDDVTISDAKINLSTNPEVIFSNVQSSVSINSVIETNGNIELHQISRNGTVIASYPSKTLSVSDNVTSSQNVNYTSTIMINGKTKTESINLIVAGMIYYGTGSAPSDARTGYNTPKESPEGTYEVNVANNGDYIFFDIPSNMTVNSITVNGFILPYSIVGSSRSGYKCYKSNNTYDAGLIKVDIK
jgi:hypothetical protein